jgi:N-acetylglucosaminyl-diphospho-decaprenol L-rhamnosyltransferase
MSNIAADGKRLAIVAVTHDSSHVLKRWIDAIEALPGSDRIELCVVDSGSSAADRARAEAICAGRLEHFVALPNVGFGGACNAGALATTAPVLLFTNPDSLFESLPSRLLDGEIAGTLLGGFGVRPDCLRPLAFAADPGLLEQARDLALGRRARVFARAADRPAWVSGSALAIDRADFNRVGGFTTDLFLYFEDADLCLRHRRAGGRIELDPDLVVRHLGGQSTDTADRAALGRALDGINRRSGRIFAGRHGRAWHRPALYALLVAAYLPRIALAALVRRAAGPRAFLDHLACLLVPRRALTRLGAVDAHRPGH